MVKRKKRRFPIGLGLVPDIRLSLFSRVLSSNRTGLAEQWVTERLTEGQSWSEIKCMLKQEAALLQMPLEQLIREILTEDGFQNEFDLENVDLSVVLEDDGGESGDRDSSENL